MSLKKIFLKTKLSYRVYLYYNLYIRHKGFLNRKQFSQWGEDQEIKKFFLEKKKRSLFRYRLFSSLYV